jgi:hypothetical protein
MADFNFSVGAETPTSSNNATKWAFSTKTVSLLALLKRAAKSGSPLKRTLPEGDAYGRTFLSFITPEGVIDDSTFRLDSAVAALSDAELIQHLPELVVVQYAPEGTQVLPSGELESYKGFLVRFPQNRATSSTVLLTL